MSLRLETYPPHERRRVNIPIESVALYRAHMSSIFHGRDPHQLSGQCIYDTIVRRTHLYQDTYLTKPINVKIDNPKPNWTNDKELTEFDEQLHSALREYKDNDNAETLANYYLTLRDHRDLKNKTHTR